ncbi:4Fe-4S dicluster domain-containing protein [Verrucomicrobiaceae bacterium N1E253]|uniref:4Fe-4S dicluster domain-containing protein n=1 Tax=Oceaniferula marina TaxID=2748318 RepID=A0A851G9L1_9BACT|nr:4Fe-4S binding protein [Oceaniferula marina]NWK54398.1 4Fe-4S dicluster domain-containing protein [Oceaniferula marina]
MSVAIYRKIRILIGALVLASCTLVFVDISHWLSVPMARASLFLQFTPSLLSLVQGLAWFGAGAVVVVLLTLLFGRIYCAMLCPMGVLMDFSAWLARRTGKKRKLPHTKNRKYLRLTVAILCFGGLLVGTAIPLGFLDPYSLFGKVVSASARPVLAWMNHQLSSTGVVQPVDISPVSWLSFVLALVILAVIVLLAIYRGRLWCNTFCPVGAVLGFFSKHSLFRLQIANSACVACSMCERVCPAQCIDFRNHRIDHSRCVMCLDCVSSCRRSGITLRRGSSKGGDETAVEGKIKMKKTNQTCQKVTAKATSELAPTEIPSMGPSLSRRFFLSSTLALPAASLITEKDLPDALDQHNKRAVLPPGAKSLAHFQNFCTGCQLCVTHCPDQVLKPSITQHGLAGFLQPYQDFSVSFCSYNCSNCSQVCPTGAIQPLTIDERRAVRTGMVRFFKGRCVVKTEGTSCGACSEHCPTQAVHMVPWKDGLTIPEIEPDLCIGCGGCEFICPVRPEKAIIVEGLEVHERAKVIELGKENTVRELEEEFPF